MLPDKPIRGGTFPQESFTIGNDGFGSFPTKYFGLL